MHRVHVAPFQQAVQPGWIHGRLGWRDTHVGVVGVVSTTSNATSSWSKRNRKLAERLIAEGRMQRAGLLQVESAREDGRWKRAYSGSADMVIPDDFIEELRKNSAAEQTFAELNRRNLFTIYHRTQTAKRPETRRKRIADVIAQLARGEAFRR